jgi:quercetin dioxygenase-like cupin family protein
LHGEGPGEGPVGGGRAPKIIARTDVSLTLAKREGIPILLEDETNAVSRARNRARQGGRDAAEHHQNGSSGIRMTEVFVQGSEREWQDLGDGVRRQILGHDEELMMVRVEFVAGAIGTAHQHPHRQASLVESGRFEVRIGDKARTLSAGDGFIVPPDVVHGVTALEAGVLVDVFTPARVDFLSPQS